MITLGAMRTRGAVPKPYRVRVRTRVLAEDFWVLDRAEGVVLIETSQGTRIIEAEMLDWACEAGIVEAQEAVG